MRQTQQDEDEDLRHELDQELDSLRSLLYAPEASTSKVEGATPVLETAALKVDEKDQEYDQFVRELVFEKRAKPKDRTKTEEEMALEEKEALEKAEKKRLRRMNGEEGDSDEEDGEGRKKGKRRERGGDDLEDDFLEGGDDALEGGLGAGLGDADAVMDGSGDEDEGGEGDDDDSEDAEDDEEDEDEEDADVMMSENEDDETSEHEELVPSSKQSSKKQSSAVASELPFTFPCPTSHDELLEIVENISDDDVPTVVKRIRTLHHPSLAEDNKYKLQVCSSTCE